MQEKNGIISFGFKIFLYLVAGLVFTDALLYYVTDHNLGRTYYDTLVVLNAFKMSSYKITYSISALVHAAMTIGVVLIALTMSHRIAGPMYRFEKVSEEIRDGKLNVRIILRENDYLKSHAAEFSSALGKMRRVLAAVKQKAGELEGISSGIPDDGNLGSDQIELLRQMKSGIVELKEGVGFFSTKDNGQGMT
jgi:methyl-accepting chemotaxis protein